MSEKPRFPSVSVPVQDPVTKKEVTADITITTDAPPPAPVPLRPQPMPPISSKTNPAALPAIEIELPARNFVRITAPLPDATTIRTTIEARNEGDVTYTWRAGQLPGLIYWDVEWAGNGAGVAKGATFVVTTTSAKVPQVAGAAPQVTVQPYAISLKKELVDLFDPEA